MTNAVVVFVADFGLASAVAVRAPAAAGLVSAFVLAAAVVEPVVAVVSGPALIFAARALVAVAAFVAAFVSAFGLAAVVAAQRDVAVASGLALIFFERAPAAVAAFVPAAFHVDRAFALFALPAVLAAHRPLC